MVGAAGFKSYLKEGQTFISLWIRGSNRETVFIKGRFSNTLIQSHIPEGKRMWETDLISNPNGKVSKMAPLVKT